MSTDSDYTISRFSGVSGQITPFQHKLELSESEQPAC